MKRLEKNSINNNDTTDIYVGNGISEELFYYALLPKDSIIGVLVLFPSTWESTENVINNNNK